jgi:hypothetical protein
VLKSQKLSGAALVVALLALVMSLGGTSYAAKLITGKDIKNNSVTKKDLKKNTITGKQVKNGSLKSADLAKGAGDDKLVYKRIPSSASGPSFDAAQADATEVVLYKKGPLTVYTKCFTDTSTPDTHSYTYVKTSTNRAIFDSDGNSDVGGDFDDYLNPDTDEDNRYVYYDDASDTNAAFSANHSAEFTAIAADGTAITGLVGNGAKHGTLAGGNGPYGSGNACVVTAQVWSN